MPPPDSGDEKPRSAAGLWMAGMTLQAGWRSQPSQEVEAVEQCTMGSLWFPLYLRHWAHLAMGNFLDPKSMGSDDLKGIRAI